MSQSAQIRRTRSSQRSWRQFRRAAARKMLLLGGIFSMLFIECSLNVPSRMVDRFFSCIFPTGGMIGATVIAGRAFSLSRVARDRWMTFVRLLALFCFGVFNHRASESGWSMLAVVMFTVAFVSIRLAGDLVPTFILLFPAGIATASLLKPMHRMEKRKADRAQPGLRIEALDHLRKVMIANFALSAVFVQ
ncbi:MAG: hypothetical protein JXB85_17490 [Anaerolineales bacterium]|nr:hypothetical protein [Anaerolineales bacterium]